jgi:hypothetical protein
LQKLAGQSKSPEIRKAAYTAWLASGNTETIWKDASGSREKLSALLSGIPSVRDEAKLAALFPLVRKLMFELPGSLSSAEDSVDVKLGPPVAFEYYQPNPSNVAVETLDKLKPKLVGSIDQFQVYVPGGVRDAFATRQSASLLVAQAGAYTFHIESDDGSRLYIDGKQLIDNDGLHGMVSKSGRVTLDAGLHQIVVTYFDNGGGDGLAVSWEGPGFTRQAIDASVLRNTSSGNLKQQALRTIAAWPGHQAEKISDFAKLITSNSLTGAALSALAAMPGKTVADKRKRSGMVLVMVWSGEEGMVVGAGWLCRVL